MHLFWKNLICCLVYIFLAHVISGNQSVLLEIGDIKEHSTIFLEILIIIIFMFTSCYILIPFNHCL